MKQESLYLVWIVLGIAGVIMWRLMRRETMRILAKERFAKRQCVSCGYDLRASDERCPECGFPIQAPDLPLTMQLHIDTMKLKQNWPAERVEARQPSPHECRVDLYASENEVAVRVLAQQLEARGICPAVSQTDSHRLDQNSLVITEHHDFKVSVWSGDVQKATEIIQAFSIDRIARLVRDKRAMVTSKFENA